MCRNEIVHHAWLNPSTHYWFVSPIFSQSKDHYRRLLKSIPKEIRKDKSDTELRFQFTNGSVIEYKSGESFDNLRGPSLNGVVIDEIGQQNKELWPLVIRPMLTTTQGWASFVGTPKGFNFFYDLAKISQSDTTGKWEYFHSPSTCNPLFTQEEYEEAKRTMTESEFAQEILAEFRDLHRGSVYTSFGEHNLRTTNPWTTNGQVNPFMPIHLYMDFNVSPISWLMAQYRNNIGHYFFDEIYIKKSDTREAIQEFIQRFKKLPEIKSQIQVVLVGDSTGNSTKTSSVGQTDYTIIFDALRQAGISFENMTPKSNPNVKDRINTVNARLRAADGSIYVWVNPTTCPNLIKDFERVSYKEGASFIIDKTSDLTLTHSSDAAGYGIYATHPIQSMGDVGHLRIIRR